MRNATLLVFVFALAATACRARSPSNGTPRVDALDLAQLVPRDSGSSALSGARFIGEPSVLLFWLKAADTLSADDQAAAFDDLKYSTEQVAPALEGAGIKLLATNSDTVYVTLPNKRFRPILLSGLDYPFGYLLVDPGGPERILTGVYPDDELMDELRAYFDLPDDTSSAQPRITT